MNKPCDIWTHQEDMEELPRAPLTDLLARVADLTKTTYQREDVLAALQKETLSPEDFAALLSPAAIPFLEEMAQKAQRLTRQYHGNGVHLFTPLYLSNYCENGCVYCGFGRHRSIARACLEPTQMKREMEAIAQSGLEEILLLTGESPDKVGLPYLAEAVKLARNYFPTIGLEVYPMNCADYAALAALGVTSITVFQETYQPSRYQKMHPYGAKRCFPYRFHTQERALRAGIPAVGFGALLGLADPMADALAVGLHAQGLQERYPQSEISLSCPRIRPLKGQEALIPHPLTERMLLQILLADRLFLPYAGITLSSRERPIFRDALMGLAVTKVSAGVRTDIGGHSTDEKKAQEREASLGEEQFVTADERSVAEMVVALGHKGLQPIFTDSLPPQAL
ncbi:2-iminoacetate synthase (ThiH) [Clostridiaceae bacterium JG1575]|nr:2-iminoacetate synthase (ThiH) [Clostridiaceae bacterium JG1575]